MPSSFVFATASRIVFGAGTRDRIAPEAAALGKRALVVTGRTGRGSFPLLAELAGRGVSAETFPVSGEPDIGTVAGGVALARAAGCDLVIGIGGGSVLDAAKAVAALLGNPGEILDFLEVVGRGRVLEHPGAPCIAVPTTAGTGAETTKNAVLRAPEGRVKASLRSPFLFPRLAVVDPALTRDMPPALTAATGLDALTQLIEAYLSRKANPLTDGICREGILRAGRSLPLAFADGGNAVAREDMALASLFGGIALANAGLGAVHGFAGPIGGSFPAPHGAVCARLLPIVMAANYTALRSRFPASPALPRFGEIARLLTGSTSASAEDGIAWIRSLCRSFGVVSFAHYGITRADLPALAAQSRLASSMQGNPVELTERELLVILEEAC